MHPTGQAQSVDLGEQAVIQPSFAPGQDQLNPVELRQASQAGKGRRPRAPGLRG